MITQIIIDNLTQNSVTVKKQSYIEIDGELQIVGKPWWCAYVNSQKNRLQAEVEIPEPYKSAVFAVWGEEPTVFPEVV